MSYRLHPVAPGHTRTRRSGRREYRELRRQQRRGMTRLADAIRSAGSHRASRSPSFERLTQEGSAPSRPPLHVIVMCRLGFGVRAGYLSEWNALGSNDPDRLESWLLQQLDPESINDSDCDNRISNANFTTLGKTADQVWADHVVPDPEWEVWRRPFTETELVTMLRAVYSKRQLYEATVRFWHDHFSIYGEEVSPYFLTYDRDVIRPNAFGNFETMLKGVARHPAMLEYLDNKRNSYVPYLENDGINENYARELLELHTLGDEHYFKGVHPDDVPRDGALAVGYTDFDVTMAARCLTGWTISDQDWDPEVGYTGRFKYMHSWHDTVTDKVILGAPINGKDEPTKEGMRLLRRLARHRSTALFIARKMCRRFIADEPPESLVQSTADVFMAGLDSDSQIADMIWHIATSTAFATTWGQKVRRPWEIFIAAMRASGAEFEFDETDTYLGLLWWMSVIGHLPFHWEPPDGYPDTREAWISSSPRVMSWDFVAYLTAVRRDNWEGPYYADMVSATPADKNTANELVDYWANRIFRRSLPAAERAVLRDYMANGAGPDDALNFDDWWDAPARMQAMVSLMFSSPSFLFL